MITVVILYQNCICLAMKSSCDPEFYFVLKKQIESEMVEIIPNDAPKKNLMFGNCDC